MRLINNTKSLIDWNQVIQNCKDGNTLKYNIECFPHDTFAKLNSIWKDAGYVYNDPCIEWTNYFPSQDIVDKFQSIVKATAWMAWISRIRPGKMAPWHYDAHSKLADLLKLGTPVRFTCYIQEPQDGHISIVGDHSLYKPEKGSIYQWDSFDDWHCGMNGGLTDKFMFNYWGYQ
jgi:hypothetical protein